MDNANQDPQEIQVKRKKGRPRKIITEEDLVPQEKKKRGRKKKEKPKEDNVVKLKKKRGRKAEIKFFSSSIRKKMPLTSNIQDHDASILHLNISEKDSVEDNTSFSQEECNIDNTNDNDKHHYSEFKMDNSLVDYTTPGKPIKKLSSVSQNGFSVLEDVYESEQKWLEKTNVLCWWCCHQFDEVPIGMPLSYTKCTRSFNNNSVILNTKYSGLAQQGKFRVHGIFCSFQCMLAYSQDNSHLVNKTTFKSMFNNLYTKVTGRSIDNIEEYRQIASKDLPKTEYTKEYVNGLCDLLDDPIQPAPPRSALKAFGGKLTIEEFRSASSFGKVYKMVSYPMFISRDYIEEVDIQHMKAANTKVFKNENNNTETKTTNSIKSSFKKVKNDLGSAIESAKNRLNNKPSSNKSISRFIL